MRVGDLVNFEAKAWVFESANREYTNPGVILNITPTPVGEQQRNAFVAEVYWADGRVTREHNSYLYAVEVINERR